MQRVHIPLPNLFSDLIKSDIGPRLTTINLSSKADLLVHKTLCLYIITRHAWKSVFVLSGE